MKQTALRKLYPRYFNAVEDAVWDYIKSLRFKACRKIGEAFELKYKDAVAIATRAAIAATAEYHHERVLLKTNLARQFIGMQIVDDPFVPIKKAHRKRKTK